jgi:hypothetical protein
VLLAVLITSVFFIRRRKHKRLTGFNPEFPTELPGDEDPVLSIASNYISLDLTQKWLRQGRESIGPSEIMTLTEIGKY